MISLNSTIYPLIRIIKPELNIYRLRELIEDFLHENAMPSFHQGDLIPAVHVTGMSVDQVNDLAAYLNKHRVHNTPFEVKSGYFIDYNLDEHHWLQSDDLIVDIAIQKFKNYPQLSEEILADLIDYSYLLCDNPNDPIHQYYVEDIG